MGNPFYDDLLMRARERYAYHPEDKENTLLLAVLIFANPVPQVLPMATREASGQNVEADRVPSHSGKSGALCDERLAGGSNPAALDR